jgi:lycopene cyclase domain-containing protein
MTYFGFLLRFLLIPILVFLGIAYWDHKQKKQIDGFRNGRAVWVGIAVHVLLAVIYTTPWDNYLVATNVWFYNPKLVTGLVIGYVPIEEYTFFIVETILAGLWWWFLARRIPLTPNPSPQHRKGGIFSNKNLVYLSTCLLASLWLLFTTLLFFGAAKWTYLSVIFFWALPPIVLQLLFGADILWHYRKLIFWSIVVPGTYLSLMDIVALKETTWSISTSQTTGILFFGILPLEEVVFFFITNMMITFGMTLLLANVSQERFAEIKNQIRAWKERSFNPQVH